jgi:hypothetical protein
MDQISYEEIVMTTVECKIMSTVLQRQTSRDFCGIKEIKKKKGKASLIDQHLTSASETTAPWTLSSSMPAWMRVM